MRRLVIVVCFSALLGLGCEDKSPPVWEGDGLLEANAEGTTVNLAWPAASDDALLEYRILQDGDEIAVAPADSHRYQVEDLDDATTYEMTVEAIDEAGNHSEPLHATVTTADETGPHWIAGAALRVQGEPPANEGEETPAGEESEVAVPRAPAVLEWDSAEDVGGVAEYQVRRGETVLATVEGMRHELGRPLEAGEREQLAVVAVDGSGNESAPLRWRADAGATLAAAPPPPEPPSETEPADPAGAMPVQAPPNVRLDPAIADRIRRMSIKQRMIDPQRLMLQQPITR